ncbi:LrgB-like family-domain-containing protein [Hypoxylon sp. NC1633]|nr:LrgB-like family-domain-containing protein [Hypoxylon sp. NC1633]
MAAAHSEQVVGDLLSAARLAFRHSWHNILQSWLYVPFGIMLMLLACFGVSKLFGLGSVAFPSSVACLVILVLALLLCEQVLGEHRTRRIVAIIEIPGGWALRWINVLFTPSFVLLPLSPPIGGIEVLKIIAVFVVGFVVMMALAAYMTRGLQLLLGSPKRALTERADELLPDSEDIPMTSVLAPAGTSTPGTVGSEQQPWSSEADLRPPPLSRSVSRGHRQDDNAPSRTPLPANGNVDAAHPDPLPPQAPIPESRSMRWAALITTHIDPLVYSVLFLLVGLPAYYTAGYAMPLHLSLNVLAYFVATALPPRWTRFLHPVLVTALLTVLGVWVLGLANGEDLDATLAWYKTGNGYAQLWNGGGAKGRGAPGAGDLFSSILDAGIVAFALPVYRFRRELRRHLAAILAPSVALSVASLFAYPVVCRAVGIGARRGLAFAARSLTLALAVPAVANLGGDPSAVAALAIMSGVVGALVGPRMLRLMRIPEDDYVTRGVTLGANSSAIAAALLLRTDPRAAALSILTMSVFGTVTVLFTSIPPITGVIQSLVGL